MKSIKRGLAVFLATLLIMSTLPVSAQEVTDKPIIEADESNPMDRAPDMGGTENNQTGSGQEDEADPPQDTSTPEASPEETDPSQPSGTPQETQPPTPEESPAGTASPEETQTPDAVTSPDASQSRMPHRHPRRRPTYRRLLQRPRRPLYRMRPLPLPKRLRRHRQEVPQQHRQEVPRQHRRKVPRRHRQPVPRPRRQQPLRPRRQQRHLWRIWRSTRFALTRAAMCGAW